MQWCWLYKWCTVLSTISVTEVPYNVHHSVSHISCRRAVPEQAHASSESRIGLEALKRRWMQEDSMPMPLANYDPIRNGLRNLKAEARSVHPVEQAQRTRRVHGFDQDLQQMQQAYGIALPARMQIEAQIVSKTRLGLPSSNIGLDALMGRLDDFSTESYLGLPDTSIDMPDFRADIEKQRGIHVRRGI